MPHGITAHNNDIWVTDVGTHQIYKFGLNGNLIKTIGDYLSPGKADYKFCKPTDVLIDDATNDIYVSDGYCNSRIVRYSKELGFTNLIMRVLNETLLIKIIKKISDFFSYISHHTF